MNNVRRSMPVKNSEKEKDVVLENMQNQEKSKGGISGKNDQVKHIAQRNFNMTNRYSVFG